MNSCPGCVSDSKPIMKIPAVIVADGVLGPDESIPENAIAVVCDGENYVVYEPGDEVPTPDGGSEQSRN